MKQNGGHFEFCMILISGNFENPFQSIQHPKKTHTGHFYHLNWPTGAKDIDI